ncbi:regulator of protease activity HflC (stomatin/prohibitin superfamily) [Trinickia symbiotica]|uniref:Protease modulator HflK n=1 Tax=Trinickia symbiotica TaxID=863227 RepID=A0A2N7WX98_9BURK|nr:protease modulator HflK [Trinickia symbiotica]PMS33855.1 protease modulator HflK [Trinickia symbiotica]PPK41148.1 regulator of protease activity HflC (stomatin/prohibitin superfamily) [Trinickia symbiotica]
MSLLARHERTHEHRQITDYQWAGRIAAGLGVAFALTSLAGALPVDVRWGAPLASAWLNAFVVANGARLALFHRVARPTRKRDWRLLAKALWRSVRQQRGRVALFVVVRSIPWQPWGACAFACASVAIAAVAWRLFGPAALVRAAISPAPAVIAGSFLLVHAFLVLVAERFFQAQAEGSPMAASLARMLRVVLLTSLAAAAASAWLAYRHTALDWALRTVAAFNAVIALELAVRATLLWFLRKASRTSSLRVPTSALAGMLRLHPSPFAALAAGLRNQYGVDFRQNWVLQSFVRLIPATLAGIGAGAWLLTSVVILGPDQRAVYERFGAPVAVLQPGLHVGLPWPFGVARIVDNGAVHQVIVSGSADDSSVAAPLARADDRTPEQLNRLWDVAHPWETTQVIAGASAEQQNFQVVSADVRLDYRVGASDADARAVLYRAADVEASVRSIANREVVRYLASHTLESLLEASQTAMAASVRAGVQGQLDRLSAGVEVVAVVIESIHPPAGAAAAYHSVQAAQVRAQASVALARAYAASELGDAQEQALQNVARAGAEAADTLARARAQQVDFDADLDASRLGGPAFLFEYYLQKIQKGLQNAHLTILDDRLAEGDRATIDLRAYPFGDLAGTQRNE